MLTKDTIDELLDRYSGQGVGSNSSNDLIKLINEIIGKLSNTSRLNSIVSGKKNIIKIETVSNPVEDSAEQNLLKELYNNASKTLNSNALDMIDDVIGELFSEYVNIYNAQKSPHKTKFGNALETEALIYMEKHPRTVKDVLKDHLKTFMNHTYYEAFSHYIKNWTDISKIDNELSDEDFNKILVIAGKFLNVVLQCGIQSGSDLSFAENKLKSMPKSNVADLIKYVNNLIENIKSITQTRAECLLLFGVCKMPNPLNTIQNSQVGDLSLLPIMKSVVDKLYETYSSVQESFVLPNGNKYTPKYIDDRAKSLIHKYLSESAKKFVENYNGEIANFENELTLNLSQYMMSCEYATLKNDIEKWKKFANSCTLPVDFYQFGVIKDNAKIILSLFLDNNINITIDGTLIKSVGDIDKLFSYYEPEEASELISHINTITEMIIPWKTLYQKLVEGEYKRNEINLITYSFDDIDTSSLFGTDVVRAYFEFKELYNDANLSEDAYKKRADDITNLLDELKPQLKYISKSMCRAFRVKFDADIFETKFNEAKAVAKKEKIMAEKGWIPGNFTLSVKPNELYKRFVTEFDKTYYSWVCNNIK